MRGYLRRGREKFHLPMRTIRPTNGNDQESLAQRLNQAMLDLYQQAGKETGYWGNYYLRSVRRHGGLATAQRMLRPKTNGTVDKGLQALIDAGRAHELSVEAIALRAEFQSLFTRVELAEASRRLDQLPPAARQQPVPPDENFPETLDPSIEFKEGRMRRVIVNTFERDPKAREACLAKHGRTCAICRIDFENVYGEIGRGFIHVHHKKPLALIREEYRIHPTKDLTPVCPNCHAMLHAKKPALTVEQLRSIYDERRMAEKKSALKSSDAQGC